LWRRSNLAPNIFRGKAVQFLGFADPAWPGLDGCYRIFTLQVLKKVSQ
jgi:hypothetical protein